MPYLHKEDHIVKKQEIDALGIVFFPNYAQFIGKAMLNFFEVYGYSSKNSSLNCEIRVVSLKIKYIKSLKINSDISIFVKNMISHNEFIKLYFEIKSKNTLVNRAEVKIVFINTNTDSIASIPGDFLKAL